MITMTCDLASTFANLAMVLGHRENQFHKIGKLHPGDVQIGRGVPENVFRIVWSKTGSEALVSGTTIEWFEYCGIHLFTACVLEGDVRVEKIFFVHKYIDGTTSSIVWFCVTSYPELIRIEMVDDCSFSPIV